MNSDCLKNTLNDNIKPDMPIIKDAVCHDNTILHVREVQKEILEKIKRAAIRVDAKVVYADLVLSPRPLLWFCGSYEQAILFVALLMEAQLGIVERVGRKIKRFHPTVDSGKSGIIYANYVKNKVQVHGITSGVEIEFCTWSNDRNSWQAPRAMVESEAEIGYFNSLDDFTFLSVTLPILRNAYEVWRRHPSRKKIDIVYTWVDGSDPAWQQRKSNMSGSSTIRGANDAARFESGTELLFSVISALRYFADLGNIYIVTDNQIPMILGDLLSEVTIVDHKDIFDDHTCLPTYNSHAIGAQLHNIPNLRQHYLYLNDDVLFGQPTSAATFYDEYGRSYQFLSTAVSTPHSKIGELESAVDAAARNNRHLLQSKCDIFSFRKFKHTPIALDRDVMTKMRKELPEAWDATIGNQFRSEKDHAISGHLYAHYSAHIGRSVVGTIKYGYFNLGASNFQENFSVALRRDWAGIDAFCINEIDVTSCTSSNRAYMDGVLRKVFPTHGIIQMAPQNTKAPSKSGKQPIREFFKAVLPEFMQSKIRSLFAMMRARGIM